VAAIVNVCVDPRLNQELIRIQVKARLERLRLATDNLFVTNEIGGNIGSSFRNAALMLRERGVEIVLAAVLHHDDCVAAQAGRRQPLAQTALEIESFLRSQSVACPVLSGTLRTEDSTLIWLDEPMASREVLSFRMPRMMG